MSKKKFDRKKFGEMTSSIMTEYHKRNPRSREFYVSIRKQGIEKIKAQMRAKANAVGALWGKKTPKEIAESMNLSENYMYKLKKAFDNKTYE